MALNVPRCAMFTTPAPPNVHAGQVVDAAIRKAAVVDPRVVASAIERDVGQLRPGGALLSDPLTGDRTGLLCATALKRLALSRGALEPVLRRALDPVVDPLADGEVSMRVHALALVDRPGARQGTTIGQRRGLDGERSHEICLLRQRELHGQRNDHLDSQAGVRALVPIGCFPVAMRGRASHSRAGPFGVASPARHVMRLDVQNAIALGAQLAPRIFTEASDVAHVGADRLPRRSGAVG